MTNNHVITRAEDIKVTLKDGRILPARVIGHDTATDLAVIKVDGQDFPFVDFENSAKPRVGDWVIAIGNPLGLGDTATAGIVSAYGRDIGDSFVDFIQIDAPINLGNSGGPTFDTYGRPRDRRQSRRSPRPPEGPSASASASQPKWPRT